MAATWEVPTSVWSPPLLRNREGKDAKRVETCQESSGIIRNHQESQNKNRVNKNQRSWRGPRDGNSNGLMIPECVGVSKGWTMEIAIDKVLPGTPFSYKLKPWVSCFVIIIAKKGLNRGVWSMML